MTDLADAAALADPLKRLNDVPIAALHLGGHCDDDFRSADLVVVNPAVRPNSPWLEIARQSGARLRTEIELFTESCQGNLIGVTGSNGKSTTAAMIASILRVAGRRVFLGGNIGGSLLDELPRIRSDDWVVLEMSSFQLWHHSPAARMPHIAVVTGCTPNHLDWHDDFRHYKAAKQRLLTGQTPDDVAVLNVEDPEVAAWSSLVRGRLIEIHESRGAHALFGDLPPLQAPGRHNRIDAACAAAAAVGAGCETDAVREGLRAYRPLPQRLELVATIEGRRFYNDSTATTPESTIAALHALDMPVWLMAGGKNKGFDFDSMAEAIAARAAGAALFGACRGEIRDSVLRHLPQFPCVSVETMAESLEWCCKRARAGEAVLLSPGCASTDQFRNFRERGERFVDLLTKIGTVI